MTIKKRLCRLIVPIIAMLLVTQLIGCKQIDFQLAKEDIEMNQNTKNLCGVFVTFGMPERPVTKQESEDVEFTVDSKGEIVFDKDTLASLNTYEVDGTIVDERTIKFGDIEGYYMGLLQLEDVNGEEMRTSMADSGFHDTTFHVNVTPDGNEDICESTISVGTDFHDSVFVNPVYQRGDGTYYTIIGQEMGFSFSGNSIGSVYSQKLDNTITRTENGTTVLDKITLKVNISVVEGVDQIFIKEMNQKDELIKITEYVYDDPEEFKVDSKTKYIIVEDIISSTSNDDKIKRSIYDLAQDDVENEWIIHPCNFMNEDNIISGRAIRFLR